MLSGHVRSLIFLELLEPCMPLGPKLPPSTRLHYLEADLKRLHELDASRRPVIPPGLLPRLDVAYHIQHYQGIPGGDSISLRHLQTVGHGRSGRKTSYYWAHHLDWVGKGLGANVISHVFSSGLSHILSKVRFIPGQENRILKRIASEAHAFMGNAGFDFDHAHVFAQGNMKLIAVEHGGRLPSKVRVHYLNFAGMPLFVRRSVHSNAPLDFFSPGHGLAVPADNLGLFLKDAPVSFKPNVLELERGDALVSYSDGVEEARNRSHRYFGLHFLEQAGRWQIHSAEDFVSRTISSLRYFVRRSEHPIEDASVLVIRHAP